MQETEPEFTDEIFLVSRCVVNIAAGRESMELLMEQREVRAHHQDLGIWTPRSGGLLHSIGQLASVSRMHACKLQAHRACGGGMHEDHVQSARNVC